MEHNHTVILDLSNCKDLYELHQQIKIAFDFPDYYGENWDAFWDCLWELIGVKTHIEIYGLDVIERKFGTDTVGMMLSIFKQMKHYRNDKYADDILIEIVDGDTRIEVK